MGVMASICDKCGGRTEKCPRYCQCDKCIQYYSLDCDTSFSQTLFFPELYEPRTPIYKNIIGS